ncbi:hypothetical protein [Rhodohalobacter halophilus]|uniref:hypothetical protein n=1 Tax=Rhodohalobacter halophilus TaxID=1812810 RepID=UPI00083F80DF|nr:hypothetical protein [Rhodohalobacter halophilus]
MKFRYFLLLLMVTPLYEAAGQSHSGFSLSVTGSYAPTLTIYTDDIQNSASIGIQASYFDEDYTRMEYGFHYSRGYNNSVSYLMGLSAAAVFQITDGLRLKPGLGVQEFKMADRSCRTTWRSILDTIFDVDKQCRDDSHTSFIGFISLEYQLAEPFSLFLHTTYRTILSSVRKETETVLLEGPNGETVERTNYTTDRSFYGSGTAVGAGFRIYFN